MPAAVRETESGEFLAECSECVWSSGPAAHAPSVSRAADTHNRNQHNGNAAGRLGADASAPPTRNHGNRSGLKHETRVPIGILSALNKAARAGCQCPKQLGTNRHRAGRKMRLTLAEAQSLANCIEAALESPQTPPDEKAALRETAQRLVSAMRVLQGHEAAGRLTDGSADAASAPQSAPTAAPTGPRPCAICGSTTVVFKRANRLAKTLFFTPALALPKKPHCANCGSIRQA